MFNLRMSAAAAALVLTGVTGLPAFAAERQKEPAQAEIVVPQSVCTAFEAMVQQANIKYDPKVRFPLGTVSMSAMLSIHEQVEHLVLQNNPAFAIAYGNLLKQSGDNANKFATATEETPETKRLWDENASLTERINAGRKRIDTALRSSCTAAWTKYEELARR